MSQVEPEVPYRGISTTEAAARAEHAAKAITKAITTPTDAPRQPIQTVQSDISGLHDRLTASLARLEDRIDPVLAEMTTPDEAPAVRARFGSSDLEGWLTTYAQDVEQLIHRVERITNRVEV